MKTQRELLEEHRKQLDEQFVKKYPNGKFTLQNFHGFSLHWCPRRSTGAIKHRGISTTNARTTPENRDGKIIQENHQSCAFGKCYNYDSLEKLLAACQKRNVPEELIAAFKERYLDRAKEGFLK